MNRKSTPISEPIAQLQRQLDEFRSTHATRTKLPEPIWQAAVELAQQHGVHAVAHPLRLDYMGLKRRLGEFHSPQPKTARPPAKGHTVSSAALREAERAKGSSRAQIGSGADHT